MNSSTLYKVLSWLVSLLIPFALILFAVRLLLTPAFLTVEYSTPGFPPDIYGFSKADRLYYANIARVYLLNDAGISFLGDLRFPEGQQTPPATCQFMADCTRFYNDRELKHMLDVKNVVKAALNVWIFSLVLVLGLGVWAWFGDWWREYRRGLSRGGWLTAILIAAILLLVLVAFGVVFVAFHNIFFQSGTWTFLYSDSLIRLFPERFWRDTFLAVGVISGGLGIILGYLARVKDAKG
jgi:integral membrane protein (TIGR01906 family)